ncbi:hypothetical protein FOZ62_004581, partial [Perkinsus olseni]
MSTKQVMIRASAALVVGLLSSLPLLKGYPEMDYTSGFYADSNTTICRFHNYRFATEQYEELKFTVREDAKNILYSATREHPQVFVNSQIVLAMVYSEAYRDLADTIKTIEE